MGRSIPIVFLIGCIVFLAPIVGGVAVGSDSSTDLPSSLLQVSEQSPSVEWERTFEGAGSDSFQDVLRTGDGGYLLVGSTESKGAGGQDGWIVKIDGEGNVQWSNTVGGPESDSLKAVEPTKDGNFLIAGSTRSFDTDGAVDSDGWLVKVEKNGDVRWNKSFDTNHVDSFSDIAPAHGGGFIVGGYTRFGTRGEPSGWIHKIYANGTKEWEMFAGDVGNQYIRDIEPLNDGGYLLTGIWDSGERDGWVRKVDENGNRVWETKLGGESDDVLLDAVETTDGETYVVGYTQSYGSSRFSGWFVRLDAAGKKLSTRTIGGDEN